MELEELITILEKSVEKNGKDKVLTIGHLLNIVKMVERNLYEDDIMQDFLDDQFWKD